MQANNDAADAAAAAQWLQLRVLSARAQGRLTREAAAHLLDDAQADNCPTQLKCWSTQRMRRAPEHLSI